MVEHIDRSVGRIMDKLDQCGLADNTLLIFFSDNGGLVSRFDRIPLLAPRSRPHYADSPLQYVATSNSPLRAEKGTLYEGGIREPLIVRWPGRIEPGTVSEAPVSSVDFYPTFLDLAGLESPPEPGPGRAVAGPGTVARAYRRPAPAVLALPGLSS